MFSVLIPLAACAFRAYADTRGGQGEKVERLYREVRACAYACLSVFVSPSLFLFVILILSCVCVCCMCADAIPAGSEEIMLVRDRELSVTVCDRECCLCSQDLGIRQAIKSKV